MISTTGERDARVDGPAAVPLMWLTNDATPYRHPLRKEPGALFPLNAFRMAPSESNRNWKALSPDGYSLTVLRARWVRVRAELYLYLSSLALCRAIFRNRRGAIIIDGCGSPAYLHASWLGNTLGARVHFSYRATPGSHRFTRGLFPLLWRRLFANAEGVLAGEPSTVEALRVAGNPSQKIMSIENSVDIDRLALEAVRARARSSSAQLGDDHCFGFIGQLIARKNLNFALVAFAAIRQVGDTFLIFGSGPQEAALRELAAKLGAAGVHFLSDVPTVDLPGVYARMHTLVLPSLHEVWGFPAAEAFSAGLHAVLSELTGAASSLGHVVVVYVRVPDWAGLAQGMSLSRREWTGPKTARP